MATSAALDPYAWSDAFEKPSAAFMGGRKPLNVLIVGGSHSGLFIGILLKRQGHNIRILERSTSSARSGLAAGIGLGGWVKRFFDENDRLKEVPLGVINESMHVLDQELKTMKEMPLGYRMTTWDATYYRLRANFDGFVSKYCPKPPAMDPDEGEGIYETGKSVLRVEEGENRLMRVLTENFSTKQHEIYEADIVVGADGANSTLRWQLQPNLQRQEPGYLLWRGTVSTKGLSQEILDAFDGRTTMCPMKNSYTIVYSIPGENGNLDLGERHINFAWYSWPSAIDLTINDVLTDKDGHLHHTTLPKGAMKPEIWSAQLAHAKATLPTLLYELANKITSPFVSLVGTICAPQASYFDNRLFLIGDAMCQLQPNTGQGTNFAAMDAMLLAEVFGGEITAEDWNRVVVECSLKEQKRAVVFASGLLNTGNLIKRGWSSMLVRTHR